LQMQGAGHTAIVSPSTDAALMQVQGLNQSVAILDGAAHAEGQGAWPSLQGPHNLENAQCAWLACEQLGLTQAQIEQGLRTYPGLPHRMERIGECDGVLFVNDSKATSPASSAPALAAFPAAQRPRIHWICGGLPKEDNLDDCKPHLGNVACAYTIGDAGPLFGELLAPHIRVEACEMLCEALRRAKANAVAGDVILFSPACASFDQFRDYESRGDAFRQMATEIGCIVPAQSAGSQPGPAA